jgi:hypothetical protein
MFRLQLFAVLLAALLLSACGGNPAQSTSSTTSNTSSGSSSTSNPPLPPQQSSPVPANANVVTGIERMPSWGDCSSNCAGEPGTNAVYSMNPGIASPSVTGSAIKFNITGGTPWADALWWKQVGGDDTKTHFYYEMQFYMDNPDAAQALEFNVNQNAGGWRYEYATQCDIRGSHTWRIWDHTAMHWVGTSAPCPFFSANKWNKLAWEFERTSDHQVKWVAVTLNGQKSDINMTFNAFTATGSGIDVAFQMDSDGGPTPWSVWVDEIKLSEW